MRVLLKNWFSLQYFLETNKAFSADTWTQAKGTFSGIGLFMGDKKRMFTRCAWHNDELFYDLNDEEKRVVHVTKDGWEIIKDSSVLFYRHVTMSAQVMPERGGKDLSILTKHYKFKHRDDVILHIVSLITKFLVHVPHAIDVLHGEKGASKTTSQRKDKSLVDPDRCDIRTIPKTKEDLAIMLDKHYFLCLDNITNISPEISDLLCMAATGGAYAKRKLFSNDDETILEFLQAVSLNGINVVATKPDLLDRCILLELERLSPSERKTEKVLWDEFNADKPLILGMIFTIISRAMCIFPTVKLEALGRMADFTIWGYAVAEAAGIGGDKFLEAYLKNQSKANTEAVEAQPVAFAILKLMHDRKDWTGNATALLKELNVIAEREQIDTKSFQWVKQHNQLSRRLREVKSNLEQLGLYVELKSNGGDRRIRIRNKNV